MSSERLRLIPEANHEPIPDVIKKNASVIKLDEDKLLLSNKYDETAIEFERYKLYEIIEADLDSDATDDVKEDNEADSPG